MKAKEAAQKTHQIIMQAGITAITVNAVLFVQGMMTVQALSEADVELGLKTLVHNGHIRAVKGAAGTFERTRYFNNYQKLYSEA